MKRYIVTEKHIRKLKDKLEESYLKIEKEWLRDWLEDIEAQEEPRRVMLEIIAGRMASHISTAINSSIYDFRPVMCFEEDFTVAAIFLPHLMPIRKPDLWEKALKAEREKDGGAYKVCIEALRQKEIVPEMAKWHVYDNWEGEE